jgi:hypothetical protein
VSEHAVNDTEDWQTPPPEDTLDDPASAFPPNEEPACGDCSNGHQPGTETTAPSYIYALGKVEVRFPSLGLEKEFMQATGQVDTAGMTDPEALHAVLSQPQNRYLTRQMCWVFTIEGVDTYILQPREPTDLELLTNALTIPDRPMDDVNDVDVVIGLRGPLAPPEMCNGLTVPIVVFDQLYSFLLEEFVDALKAKRKALDKDKDKQRDEVVIDMLKLSEGNFTNAAQVMFRRIHQLTDNAGATDEDRALNYLAVRYDRIYQLATVLHHQNYAFSAVEVRPSRLSGVRNIVDVIFSFTSRETDVTEKWFVRVDMTEEFPFLVNHLTRFFDR